MNSMSVPTEVITIYNEALQDSNRGNFDKALIGYYKAIEIYPDFIEAYNNIGEIYSQLGDKDQAISSYTKALTISRDHRVLLNIGVEYYNSKNFSAALKYFQESTIKKIDFVEGNFYTAMVYYNMENFIEAEKFFLKVLSSDKNHLKTNYLLSTIYYERKDYKKAIKCLDNIKDITDDKTFLNKYYGFCYYYLGDYKKAVKFLKTALESKPEYKKFKTYLKSLTYENKLKEIGDVDSAIKELEEQILGNKSLANEVTKLSMLYIFKGENKKAEKLLLKTKKNMKKKIAS